MKLNLALLILIAMISCKVDYDVAIINVNLIDGTGNNARDNINVYISGNRIAEISTASIPAKIEINGSGKFLIPGLMDAHTHPDPIEETADKFIHYGVTSILVTGCKVCTDDHYSYLRKLGNQHEEPCPRIFHTSQHFTLEGSHPVKTYPNPKWQHEKTIFLLNETSDIPGYVERVASNPIEGIKVTIEDGPDPPYLPRMQPPMLKKIVEEAARHDLEIYAHVSDIQEVRIAQQAGVQNYVHFVGVDINWETDEMMIDSLLTKKVSWVTTLMMDKSFLYPLNPDWLNETYVKNIFPEKEWSKELIARKMPYAKITMKILKNAMKLPEPVFQSLILEEGYDLKKLKEKGCNLVVGTDTGNDFVFPGYSVHEEMQLLEMGGFDPLDIIKMTTLNGSKMLGTQDSLGSIEVGKIADMVLLNKSPLISISNTLSIHSVIKNGRIQKSITDRSIEN